VSSRQKRRQLHKLRDFTAKALLFYDSFGLTPENVTCSLSSGESLAIAVGDSASPSGISPSITAEQRDGAKQVLYLLDRFGVSDEFYHELAQVSSWYVRTYLQSSSLCVTYSI